MLLLATAEVPRLLPVEYVVIGIYLVLLAAVGPVMKSFNKNSDDYFRGGARTRWWLLGPSLAISIISAAAFTGVAGAIFEAGLSPMASNVGQWTAGIILILFLAAWLRQLRKITGAEVIRERFGPATEQFFAYLNMCMMPMYGAFQLLGLSIFVAAVFLIPLEQIVIVLGVVVGFYSVSGGKWAVMATDFLQNLVLQAVVVAVGVLAIVKLGGVGSFFERVNEVGGFTIVHEPGAFPDGQYTFAWVIAVFCIQFIGQLQLGWSARFFAAKDGNEARKATALMFAILIGSVVFFLAAPLAARVLYPDQVAGFAGILNKPAESAYVVVCLNLLPAGMMGLVLVAMFSATAAAMDSGLNSNAAVIVRNIVPPLRRLASKPQLDGVGELKWGQRITFVLAGVIILLTLALAKFGSGGIFELMLNFASRVQLPMTIPFVLVIFLRNAPRSSAIFAIASGFLLPLAVLPLLGTLGIEPDFTGRLLIVAGSSLLGFFSSYVLGPNSSPEDREQTRQFYADMHRPVDFEKEVGHANDREQLLLLGRLSAGLGVLLYLLLLIPNDLAGRLTIVGIATSIALIGAAMLLAARHTRRKAAKQ
jgi:Na+/proline symporter